MDWQPIETAPKDGTWILAVVEGVYPVTGEPYIPAVVHFTGGEWLDDDWKHSEDVGQYEPTHWQPLPSPPESKET